MIPWTEIIIVLVVLSGLAWWGIRQIDAYTTPIQREHDEQAAQSERLKNTKGR